MVASRATMREMIARVIMTAYSCFPGFHSSSCLRVRPWWGSSPRSREEEEEGVSSRDRGITVRDGRWRWVGIKLSVDGI